jgi:type II secretion system (T2SS) protein M
MRSFRLRLSFLDKASLALLGLALAFSFLAVKPLQERSRLLASRISPEAATDADAKVAELYRFLGAAQDGKEQTATDWLARLYGIGRATGIELQSARYATPQAGGRIARYEIVLPVSGTYAQLRDFLKRALAEIPVLSLDQMTLKRDNRTDGSVAAELHLTLHMVRP